MIGQDAKPLRAARSETLQVNIRLFCDIRERRLMGGFFESHQEGITDFKFHPTDPDIVASGSTDVLINIFDSKKDIGVDIKAI